MHFNFESKIPNYFFKTSSAVQNNGNAKTNKVCGNGRSFLKKIIFLCLGTALNGIIGLWRTDRNMCFSCLIPLRNVIVFRLFCGEASLFCGFISEQ